MDKILLILQREYLSRVQKRSFLLTTFLTPLLFGGLYFVAIFMAVNESDLKTVNVIDESGIFESKLKNSGSVEFVFQNSSVDSQREELEDGNFYALLHIPSINIDEEAEGITLYSVGTPSIDVKSSINNRLERIIEDIRLDNLGISKDALKSIETDIKINSINLSGDKAKEGSSEVAMAVGVICGMLIYVVMLVYGAQVMRGVIQEKTSKIVEIIVSSVKPFQLMMGKILGVAAVGLTQFALWIILSAVIMSFAGYMMGVPEGGVPMAGSENEAAQAIAMLSEAAATINIPLIIGSFLFYFLTGYLFYAALFAMVGSAVDSEADTQQMMMPIMLPIIGSIMMLGAVIKDPSGPLAFWMSMIPFSSPIIMMIRIPFDVPAWQIVLSMVLMILGFLGTTWVAARVYRVGILMHGSKVNFKIMMKWLMMKN